MSKAQIERLHKVEIKEIGDPTSRFSYKVVCSCGIQGHFYSKEDAEKYAQYHKDRKAIAPF